MPRNSTRRPADRDVLVFKATLTPKIYRTFEIDAKCSLYELAEATVSMFDFQFDHAFGFYSNLKGRTSDSDAIYELFVDIGESDNPKARGVERTRAADAFPVVGHKMRFVFDYGDMWEFVVEFKEKRPQEPRTKLPRILLSAGQAPEQYPGLEDDDE